MVAWLAPYLVDRSVGVMDFEKAAWKAVVMAAHWVDTLALETAVH